MTNKDKIHVDDFLKSGFADQGRTPGAHVWLNIEQKIAARNKKRRLVLYFVAALYLCSIAGIWQSPQQAIFAALRTKTIVVPETVSQKRETKISTTTDNKTATSTTSAPVAKAATAQPSNTNSVKQTHQEKSTPSYTSAETSARHTNDRILSKSTNVNQPEGLNANDFSAIAISFPYLADPGSNFRHPINIENLNNYYPFFYNVKTDTSMPEKKHSQLYQYLHQPHTSRFFAEAGFNVVKPFIDWSITNENKKFAHKDIQQVNNNKAKNAAVIVPEFNVGYHLANFDIKLGYSEYHFDYNKNFYMRSDSAPFIIDKNYGILAYRKYHDTAQYIIDANIKNPYSFVKLPIEITYNFNLGKSLSINAGVGSAIQFSKSMQQGYFNKLTYSTIAADSSAPTKTKSAQDLRFLLNLCYRFPKSNTSLLLTSRYTYNLKPFETPPLSLFTSRMRTFELGIKLKYDF